MLRLLLVFRLLRAARGLPFLLRIAAGVWADRARAILGRQA